MKAIRGSLKRDFFTKNPWSRQDCLNRNIPLKRFNFRRDNPFWIHLQHRSAQENVRETKLRTVGDVSPRRWAKAKLAVGDWLLIGR
jgi:hypothetical protein